MSPAMVNATGSVRKQVTCEFCQHPYDYELKRTACGSFSGFAMTTAEANEKAALDAAEKLKAMLETECDPVPCPKCGRLTAQMRATKAAIIPQSAGLMLLGAAIVGGAFLVGRSSGFWFYGLALLGAGLFLLSGFVLLVSLLELIGGDGAHGWQAKLKPQSVRTAGYITMFAGVAVMAGCFSGRMACLAIGSVILLIGGTIYSVAKDRMATKPPPSANPPIAER